MSLATCGQIPESKLDKLYKHLHSRKEAMREGQDKVVGGDDIDNDKGAAKPIKKLIIVSSKDNKTIIETIQTEEEKRNYIERSRIKRKRIKLEPSRKVMVKGDHMFTFSFIFHFCSWIKKDLFNDSVSLQCI